MDEPLSTALRHNAEPIDKGPPALYRLNTERKYIDGTNKKVRQGTYGQRDRKKQNKVILLVGETGAGKTTIINTMTSYLLGVKFDDQEFYQITEETEPKDQSQSQTSDITVYEVFAKENPTSLTIIDTPGFGNTEEHEEGLEKDREISEYLMRLFSDQDGVHSIDAVCFVMKASQNRLPDREFYIFHSVLSLFGRDIEENIVFLLTFSDAIPPIDAFNAIKIAEIPCRRDNEGKPVHFLFNNQQKRQRDKKHEQTYRSLWEMGERSMDQFFTFLNNINRKSVQMTLDVLKERKQLEACVNNLVARISHKESKTEELNQIQEALRQNRHKIKKCENFQFRVKRVFKEKVLIENEWPWNSKATCCSVCEENCHEWGCWLAIDPSDCWVMKDKHCTVCTKKCHYSKHVRENKKYVTKTKNEIMTFDELKHEYEDTDDHPETSFNIKVYENTKKVHESIEKEFEDKTKIEKILNCELEKIEKEKSTLLTEAYTIIMSLSNIMLKSDNAFTLQHLDFLIPRWKEEGKHDWIKNLEDLIKAGEERKNKGALKYLLAFGRQQWKKLLESMTTERHRSMDEPLSTALRHNAEPIDKGPPALYRLNTERKYIDGTNKKVRQWTYGQRDRNKQNTVILLVGETGAGKTTIINTMTSYILGVKFDDQEFYQITEEDIDESLSQAHQITVYEVFAKENPTSLTIIDTPGFGNTEEHEKDREISEYLMRLFSDQDGVHSIDAVCFVMKASQNRLSDREFYIFHSVLSLFGRDIEENIVFLLTFSDGGPPADALNAIKIAEIPCRRDNEGKPVHFLFNNQQKRQRDAQYEQTYRSLWEMGERSLDQFFTFLNNINRKSVQMTSNVLKERKQLEACVNNLVDRISHKESKTEELNQIQEVLRQNRHKIKKCENFQFRVKRVFKEKVLIENEWPWNSKATCCSVCEENCHESGCCLEEDSSDCWVMKNKHCTVCTKKCHYSKHVRENKKYVTKTKNEMMTFDELKHEYEDTDGHPETSFNKKVYENTKKEHESIEKESEDKTEIEKILNCELEKIEKEKSTLLTEAYMIIMSLSNIMLKSDNAFTLQHLDFLIPRWKEEGKHDWIKNLEDLIKAGEERKNKGALKYLLALGRHQWNKFFWKK